MTVTGAQKNAGDHTAVASALSNANYALPAVDTKAFTIGRKALTVKADDKTKVQGQADPALTYSVTGLVGSDALSGSLTRDSGEAVGSYAIRQGTLDAGANYTLAFTGATFTIKAREGNTTVEVDTGAGVPTTQVSGLTKALAEKLATPEERARMEAGEPLLVYLDIRNIDGKVSTGDMAQILAAVTSQDYDAKVGMCLDMSVYKQVGNGDPAKLTDLQGNKLRLTFSIPENLRKEGRLFFIVRVHDGVAEIIATGTGDSITGESDLFSTYALIYADKAEPPSQMPETPPGQTPETPPGQTPETPPGQTPEEPPTQTPEAAPDYTLLAAAKASGSKAMKLSWTAVGGAEGYDIFFGKCGGGNTSLIASVRSSEPCSYTISGLKKATNYKGFVQAWQTVNGAKTYIGSASPELHVVTGDRKGSWTNAKKVTVKASKVTLAKGKTSAIKASAKGTKSGLKVLKHITALRYYSSDRNVATVNAKGKITAVGAGKCTVYVLANNGVRASVKVTVVDQPTKIGFKKKSYSVKKGKTLNLARQIKFEPDGVKSACTWESSNKAVATVSANGVVKGIKKGTAKITVRTANGKQATVKVTVK